MSRHREIQTITYIKTDSIKYEPFQIKTQEL